ncbi:hypothetical protein [Taibaiella chishuiensis]|uniref:Uncharacterized protein n=1 Tax=Taibaiella chishuiensis TaxID=1434707 RepID=A0A2P8DAY1_9BACT|nr:hypothetical protein [Taibaiella chishuiensis]PSK94378.1 hypothetical protein B0I18_101533 [Taibaiella chishuiensis]
MKFSPYENFVLRSRLSPEAAADKLEKAVVTFGSGRSSAFSSDPNRPFRGTVSGTDFKITRIIGYRNSFAPVITGTLSGYPGTELDIRMRMHTGVLIFCCIWMGAIGLSAILAATGFYNTANAAVPFPMLPICLFMLVAAYVMATAGFKYESRKSKNLLKALLEAEIL